MEIKLTDGTTAIVSDDFNTSKEIKNEDVNPLMEKTKKELIAMAEEKGIEVDSKFSKEKIIELLNDVVEESDNDSDDNQNENENQNQNEDDGE